ncbi:MULTISPECIES: phage portal protein [Moraxella]|uniref:Phage-related capsid packaging protein n=1 Tax=Moraxella catarrhalis TaxID=480 RepID=A0A7Z0UXQ7_MORCA|nr:phage portal protein [Moraxella catarrhalis]OAV00207.1 Phage-related capsid packaging protein [Moraxella catarrhalis]STY82475.1 phage portal protein, PBSX family [Moraxella catarrhalis]
MTITPHAQAFTFGDPEPLSGREIFDYVECYYNGRWYEPPTNLHALSRCYKSMPYLSSGIVFKRNFLANLFIPSKRLSRKSFEQIALDFTWCGNAYLEEIRSVGGGVIEYRPALAKYTRRGRDGEFWMLYNDELGKNEYKFKNRVHHVKECDINQEVYGAPEYFATLQSAWLNESATLFRRKYYNNGSHAGFILYVNDPANDPNDIDALRKALKESKGPGNFRNLFFYSPNGKKDGIQIIPVSEIAAKDDFGTIKNITRDDVLSSLRIPPQLMGIVPVNSGGFGSIKDASEMFWYNEILPMQRRISALNELTGEELVRFKDYDLLEHSG